MITYLRGTVVEVEEHRLVMEVGGIGYQIGISGRDALNMPSPGETVKIHTYMSVREDAISLFGFLQEADLKLYRLLIGVSGVGPKAGLSILSVLDASQVVLAVMTDDAKMIAKAPGVGPKMAKKVILELKDRVDPSLAAQGLSDGEEESKGETNQAFEAQKAEAIEILTALGYSRSEAVRAVRHAALTEDMDADAILAAALAT